ncbi:hypothetical protein LCGC14_1532400 [marine sediment metagenome]|uniref:DegT/DnrJ/EryC1/StrS aminotransferase family protein n=1 Tax=marine sediment metagenome TaxID=412755 RepID=A0A0F9LBE7_9ZZZZ
MSKFIPQYAPDIRLRDIWAVVKQMQTGWVGPSKATQYFEDLLRSYCSTDYCYSTTSGTTAIMMALYGLDLPPGSTILFPAYTFLAGANAARLMGFKVRLVDIKRDTLCMDPDKIRITKDVSCVIFVRHNTYDGQDMDKVKNICQKKSVKFLEDAAQCVDRIGFGRYVGDVVTISFSVPKLITTGQGGAVLTNNTAIAARCIEFRDHGGGWRENKIHDKIGGNFKFNDILAAFGISQLQDLGSIKKKRDKIFEWYKQHIDLVDFGYNSTWMVIYRAKRPKELIEALSKHSIQAVQYYKPVSHNPPYKTRRKFPVAEQVARELVYLPSSLNLKRRDIRRICKILLEVENG